MLAEYLGCKLIFISDDTLSKDELQLQLGKNGKITHTRVGELIKAGRVCKTADDKFSLITIGVAQLKKKSCRG